MLRQYRAQRRKGGHNPLGIGTVDVGTIFYLQGYVGGGVPAGASAVRRAPWIVVSWHNREYHPAVRGRPHTTYMTGGHLATVRCLRTGRERKLSDAFLLWHADNDLTWSGRCRSNNTPRP